MRKYFVEHGIAHLLPPDTNLTNRNAMNSSNAPKTISTSTRAGKGKLSRPSTVGSSFAATPSKQEKRAPPALPKTPFPNCEQTQRKEAEKTSIGRRLPVRASKLIPSIETPDSKSPSSCDNESRSDSEYEDEISQRRPGAKPCPTQPPARSQSPNPSKPTEDPVGWIDQSGGKTMTEKDHQEALGSIRRSKRETKLLANSSDATAKKSKTNQPSMEPVGPAQKTRNSRGLSKEENEQPARTPFEEVHTSTPAWQTPTRAVVERIIREAMAEDGEEIKREAEDVQITDAITQITLPKESTRGPGPNETNEITALQSELQFAKGKISAYERTLQVDGVQMQHKLAFDAEIKRKALSDNPGFHQDRSGEEIQGEISKATQGVSIEATKGASAESTKAAPSEATQRGADEAEKLRARNRRAKQRKMEKRKQKPRRSQAVPGSLGWESHGRANRFTRPEPYSQRSDPHVQGFVNAAANVRATRGNHRGRGATQRRGRCWRGGYQGGVHTRFDDSRPEAERSLPVWPDQPRLPVGSSFTTHSRALAQSHDACNAAVWQPIERSNTVFHPSAAHGMSSSVQTANDVVTHGQEQPHKRSRVQQPNNGPHKSESATSAPVNTSSKIEDVAPAQKPSRDQPASIARVTVHKSPNLSIRNPTQAAPTAPGRPGTGFPRGELHRTGVNDRQVQRWRPYDRREVYIPEVLPRCICRLLHFYFESGLNTRPSLETFPGTREQFYANVEQIARCHGHDKEMIIFCQGLWASEQANKKVSA